MSNEKHTPKDQKLPWTVKRRGYGHWVVVDSEGKAVHCKFTSLSTNLGFCKLVAEAPELKASLDRERELNKRLVEALKICIDMVSGLSPVNMENYEKLIKEAEAKR